MKTVFIAVNGGVLSVVCGLIASFYWDSATGARIIPFASGFFKMSPVNAALRGGK